MTIKRIHVIRCCSGATDNEKKSQTRTKTPQILKLAVSGVTELLRVFSFSGKERYLPYYSPSSIAFSGCFLGRCPETNKMKQNPLPELLLLNVVLRLFIFSLWFCRLEKVNNKDRDEISVSGIDEVIMLLKSDYENAYFVTGVFTSAIYDEDCVFEDPTIKFQGTKLYSRNLKLLVPFFDSPSIGLQNIEKGVNSETYFVLARWKLRTYLKFPWRPLISIDGSTVYELDNKLKIVRHAESWNVSALEAIGQIFTPSFDRPGK
ncbi:hypothetical protein POTOM_045119 [Populus tomentosa]|uniref:NTF2-like domain-containing protein n=4 Tax=Populus TaxID=3689 RepID=A0A8X7YGF6_POPTO|nr:hypothetical protein POTOM_045119 [Populus tomentosa]